MTLDPDWRARGVCRQPGAVPDRWFDELAWAVQECKRLCEVQRECLELALAAEGSTPVKSRYGVWGGLTPGKRHKEYRRRKAVAASGDPPGQVAA